MIVKQVEEMKQPAKPFPKLMISKSCNVVLFSSPKVGVAILVENDGPYTVGEHIEDWVQEEFTDYTGKLEVSND